MRIAEKLGKKSLSIFALYPRQGASGIFLGAI
jgi:uncharacterized protein (DUF3084 family)